MKKLFLIIPIFLIIISVSTILIKPKLEALIKTKIQQALPDSTISIETVKLDYTLWSLLNLKASAEIHINNFQHDKFKARNILAKLRWEGKYIYLDSLIGKVLNGTVNGDGKLTLGKPLKYLIQLNFSNLDLASFVEDFELKEKVEMTGLLNGKTVLSGLGKNIQILNGDFIAPLEGGNVTIKDTRFLENMAHSSKLPSNVVVDSFKDYHYNGGMVHMFLDKNDLNMDVALEGITGKRNLKICLHDFNLK